MRTIPRTERRSLLGGSLITATILACAATSVWALPSGAVPRDPGDLTRRVLEARARQVFQAEKPNPAEMIRERIERARAEHPPVPDVNLPAPHELIPPQPAEVPNDAADLQLLNTAPAQGPHPDGQPSQAETFRPAVPARPATRIYKIQKGDTLGVVAQKQLGTVKRLPDIMKLNPGLNPRKLRVGQEIKLPTLGAPSPDARQPRSPGSPTQSTPVPPTTLKTTKVEKGETLGHISQRVYGTVKHWKHILKANADTLKDPKKLRVGMTLKIPPMPQ